MSSGEFLRVFRPEMDTVAHDPLDPRKRYHDGIFIETDEENGEGTMYHVTGDIIAASGMRFDVKEGYAPQISRTFHRTTKIGTMSRTAFKSKQVLNLLKAIPTPTKQQGLNFWQPDPDTGRHELVWTREDGELYGPNEQRRPIVKCNEWTDMAIEKLEATGLLKRS